MTISGGMVIYCQNPDKNRNEVMYNSTGKNIVSKQIRKHKSRRNIDYQVFDDMREVQKEFDNDPFWDSFLVRASKNNFPRNFKFIDNKLVYKNKSKKYKEEFPIEKPEDYEEMKKFLKSKGILSKIDEKEIEEEYNKIMREYEPPKIDSWKQAGKMKNVLISKCIEHLKNALKLSPQEVENLDSVIRIGRASEIFGDETISVRDGKITSIKYLKWDEKERFFYFDPEMKLKKKKASRSSNNTTKNESVTTYTLETNQGPKTFLIFHTTKEVDISKKWSKFLDHLKVKGL